MEWRRRALTLLACLLVVVTRASSREIAQDIMDSHMRHLQENRRTVQLLKNLLEDLDVNMETVQKRTACYISAGMGHSCDYRDIIGAADEAKYWKQEFLPGKRRRRDNF